LTPPTDLSALCLRMIRFLMSFRFRKSFKLFPGVRLNLSKSGLSISAGIPGATLNFGTRGAAVTVGIPGSGLSYRANLGGQRPAPTRGDETPYRDSAPSPPSFVPAPDGGGGGGAPPGEIRSADVAHLTTPDLAGLKEMIRSAIAQRFDLEREFTAVADSRRAAWVRFERARKLPLRVVMRSRLPALQREFDELNTDLAEIADAHFATEVQIDFDFDPPALEAFTRLAEAHRRLGRAARVWDVTSSVKTDRREQRTSATSAVTRTPISLQVAGSAIIASRWPGLTIGNANGEDMQLFPGLCLVQRAHGGDYALIDLREMRVEFRSTNFIEDEAVPRDAEVIEHTWAKVNLDGSPDRRFRDNRQIPIVRYGRLDFVSRSGVTEAVMVSDVGAAQSFADCYQQLVDELERLAQRETAEDANQNTDGPALLRSAGARRLVAPSLPNVPGAHGYTAAAAGVLALAVGGAWTASDRLIPPSPSLPVSEGATTAATQPPTARAAVVQPSATPATPSAAPALSASPAPPAAAASQAERMMTRQAANIRAEPNGNAPVLRTATAGTTLTVFARSGPWVQVGDTQPTGWIHNSLLSPAR
jgi:hypothetical protein